MTYIPHHFQCSVCGAPKREINHWFIAYDRLNTLLICPWDEDLSKEGKSHHLCGSECLLKWVGKKAEELNR